MQLNSIQFNIMFWHKLNYIIIRLTSAFKVSQFNLSQHKSTFLNLNLKFNFGLIWFTSVLLMNVMYFFGTSTIQQHLKQNLSFNFDSHLNSMEFIGNAISRKLWFVSFDSSDVLLQWCNSLWSYFNFAWIEFFVFQFDVGLILL